jgi:hypothetical protein
MINHADDLSLGSLDSIDEALKRARLALRGIRRHVAQCEVCSTGNEVCRRGIEKVLALDHAVCLLGRRRLEFLGLDSDEPTEGCVSGLGKLWSPF